jgi:hypothetical protein
MPRLAGLASKMAGRRSPRAHQKAAPCLDLGPHGLGAQRVTLALEMTHNGTKPGHPRAKRSPATGPATNCPPHSQPFGGWGTLALTNGCPHGLKTQQKRRGRIPTTVCANLGSLPGGWRHRRAEERPVTLASSSPLVGGDLSGVAPPPPTSDGAVERCRSGCMDILIVEQIQFNGDE